MAKWVEVPATVFLRAEEDTDVEAFLEQFGQEVYENVPLYQTVDHLGLDFDVSQARTSDEEEWVEVPATVFLRVGGDTDIEGFLEQFRQEIYENVPLYQTVDHLGLDFDVSQARTSDKEE